MDQENKQTLSYFIYMANKWSQEEASYIYGAELGNHIWNKYTQYIQDHGLFGAYAMMAYELDEHNFGRLVTRANNVYYGRESR